jgi:hypothetical protein
LLTSCS